MSRLITKRPKRAVQRGADHSYVEIDRIVRSSFNSWGVDVTYTYGRSTWHESVTFTRTPRTRKNDIIVVVDTDYPEDRACRMVVGKDADIVTTIITFLHTGRW